MAWGRFSGRRSNSAFGGVEIPAHLVETTALALSRYGSGIISDDWNDITLQQQASDWWDKAQAAMNAGRYAEAVPSLIMVAHLYEEDEA